MGFCECRAKQSVPGFGGTVDASETIIGALNSYLDAAYGGLPSNNTGDLSIGSIIYNFLHGNSLVPSAHVGLMDQAASYQTADGNDLVVMGSKDDIVYASSGNDIVDGGGGSNTADYSAIDTNLKVTIPDLSSSVPFTAKIENGSAGTDYLFRFQSIKLGSGSNTFEAPAVIPNQLPSGLKIDGGWGGQSTSAIDTLDFTKYSKALTINNGLMPDTGITFTNFNRLIGTANGCSGVGGVPLPGGNPFSVIDGGGGSDTFNVDYSSDSGASDHLFCSSVEQAVMNLNSRAPQVRQ